MSFHLSAWSIKKPVPTIVTFLILGIVGITSFLGLGIDDTPNIDIPVVSINITQRGASPTELENQVTKKVEDAVANLDDIDELVSTVTEGNSTTTINFELGTDADQAVNEVRNEIAQIRPELPQDINEPIVQKLAFAGGTVITYAVKSESRSVENLSNYVDKTLIPQLLNVEGVGQIDRWGGVDREVRVDLDPDRLLAYDISATEVNQQIRDFNINLAGGKIQIGGNEQNIRTLGSAKNIRELQQYPIRLGNGDTVTLNNLGTVEDAFAEPTQAAYLNGDPVVAFAVKRSTGSTLVSVEEGIRQRVAQLEPTLPEDIKLELIFTRADSIRGSYNGTIMTLVFGCVLTVITVGIFLRDWRSTLITGTALPLSIIPTFWVMQLLNYTLNGMSLLALALAIGNLVDDAICMLENIDRHLQMGKTPLKAALDGSREIGLAVVATTSTIVAVFIPVAFMGGVPGQFFQPFGVTVAVSTMFSTLVACTVTPMLSAYLLRSKPIPTAADLTGKGSQRRPYASLLRWSLRHRFTTLLFAIAFFIGSLQLVPFIPKGLFSDGDTGLSTVIVELPPGSRLQDTEEVTKQLGAILQDDPAISSYLNYSGAENKINSAQIFVNLAPKETRELDQKQWQQKMRGKFAKIPGARISFRSQGGGGGSKDLSLILRSDNPQVLTNTAKELEAQMGSISGLVEISSSVSLVRPEIVIEPDPQRASDLGVSVQAIARTASLTTIGDNDFNLAKFNLSDRQIPIRVQIDPAKRQDINNLKNLRVPSDRGTLVPLDAVATIRLGSGPNEIQRFDRSRRVTVEANLQGLALGDAVAQVRQLPIMSPLPPEVREEPAGDAKIMRDIFARFLGALSLAILCIYAILVLLYNNFLYPMAILVALPLSVGGALMGLLVTQKELGLFALIGVVLLMGLVTKNAILLVDFALAGIERGKPQFKAVVEAGVSRLRPILMTSISTIAGMMPIALELGADGEVRSPMAIAVIGGFTTSTLLTLVVVPVLFTYVDGFYHWLGKSFRKILKSNN
ncbi:cation/multidrug efflux pump [Xenococcus sp. PCC 7305]|uniref:efflux RND transporter permease subunit n=1 Tax=Xenococcus sp. PCC 7305 TaxID=102125 RepID=UPI0002ACC441|nr:efflux RND transporter permease subunit [Xenococcus sp. PCC 7305]ELS02450.1 cation/multidrug efflux pump [Xenococcus sp. PCC 7305]